MVNWAEGNTLGDDEGELGKSSNTQRFNKAERALLDLFDVATEPVTDAKGEQIGVRAIPGVRANPAYAGFTTDGVYVIISAEEIARVEIVD